ncbi:DnaJ homolog subfamily B member 8 [Triticum urartu]|uniref:DnaJ homolog subfamily B member 8 n=1 Tax=Triticum urartu TaxID=4572 RepID=M7YFD5_TRIUA|nr:DnaJ homolog subfamily B member 8 [Triticum urartu]
MGFSGGVKCQRRARVRVSAVAATPERATMYDVLAVGTSAGPEEIKAAYRRAARRWHPDACPGGADRSEDGVVAVGGGGL